MHYYTYQLYISVLLHSSAVHTYLHSFPTRRSSDLIGRRTHSQTVFAGQPGIGKFDDDATTGAFDPAIPPPLERVRRSEEHTSELQSPYDLVCRLLLEKKKKYK